MKEGHESISYANKYHLIAEDYMDVPITSLSFSIRVMNRLMQMNIMTLADLLTKSPELLLGIQGFGRKCLDEIDDYCFSLTNSDEPIIAKEDSVSTVVSSSSSSSSIWIQHKEEIAIGDFSFVENLHLSNREEKELRIIKEAYELLGEDLVLACFCDKDVIHQLSDSLQDFVITTKYQMELFNDLQKIQCIRRKKKAIYFIDAYSQTDSYKNRLLSIYGSEDATLDSVVNNREINTKSDAGLIRSFLQWCAFDISEDIQEIFQELFSKDRLTFVLQGRASGKTLMELADQWGITRERIRQIEKKAVRIYRSLQDKKQLVSKLRADMNGDNIVEAEYIEELAGEYSEPLLYLLKSNTDDEMFYDKAIDSFVFGKITESKLILDYIDTIPSTLPEKELEGVFSRATEENINRSYLEKLFFESYSLSGDTYVRKGISSNEMFSLTMAKHFPNGIYAYSEEDLNRFREMLIQDFGEVNLPENTSLSRRIVSICMLCDRGLYKPEQDQYISDGLAKKIQKYISTSPYSVIPLTYLFRQFQEALYHEGVGNKYYFQGILKKLFGDTYIIKKDYIYKDSKITSVSSAIINYIRKANKPVTKAQVKDAFQGIPDVVLNIATSDKHVINLFGLYVHGSNLKLSVQERNYLLSVVRSVVEDGKSHHCKEIYDIISDDNPDILSRNAALSSFGAFSVLEYLFGTFYQFSRPYVALNGTEMQKPIDRLHELVYSEEEYSTADLRSFVNDNYVQINSLLEFFNSCNDKYLLINDTTIMSIEKIGVSQGIAEEVENLILSEICTTTPIRNMTCLVDLPRISISWSEWLVYSVIKKWGTRLDVSTTSNQLRYAIPLISPKGQMDESEYLNMKKEKDSGCYEADDLENIDDLISDYLEDDFLLEE